MRASPPERRLGRPALALALSSAAVHTVGAVQGGDRGLLYLVMALTCTACAAMTCRTARIRDWFMTGLMTAAMLSAHVLLMGGSEGQLRHLSLEQHLAYHAHGHGFDVLHVAGGLAVLELVLCLYVLTTHAVGGRTGAALTTAPARRPG